MPKCSVAFRAAFPDRKFIAGVTARGA
ncbi:hypothetical protein EMGBS8_19980, partial [Verrucomicrobiota bacterium]